MRTQMIQKRDSLQEQKQAETQTENVSDALLVIQAMAGEQGAFEALVSRYQNLLFKVIYTYLRDYDQTYDVLQQVLLKWYKALPTLKLDKPLKAWLVQIAKHCSLDELRKRKRRQEVHFSELEDDAEEESFLTAQPDAEPLPEEYAEYQDLLLELERALQTLPPTWRAVVLLRCQGHLSFSQIGQALRMPEGTAKANCYRARVRLHTQLISRQQIAV
jgi:RNA polymerase sigma factor (sigma-70 family)